MPKFKFECESEDNSKVTMEIEEVFLDKVLGSFAYFLRGCGYSFDEIEHVRKDEVVIKQSELPGFDDE